MSSYRNCFALCFISLTIHPGNHSTYVWAHRLFPVSCSYKLFQWRNFCEYFHTVEKCIFRVDAWKLESWVKSKCMCSFLLLRIGKFPFGRENSFLAIYFLKKPGYLFGRFWVLLMYHHLSFNKLLSPLHLMQIAN